MDFNAIISQIAHEAVLPLCSVEDLNHSALNEERDQDKSSTWTQCH